MGETHNQHELVLLDQADRALSQARSLQEIKVIRDKAEAVRKYAESASLGLDVQNRAAEVKLRAERQAGQLLSQLTLRGGDRRSKSHRDRLKLVDLGLTSNQSKRWQMQARVPEDLFRQHIQETRQEGRELTSAGLMRLAKRLQGGRLRPQKSPPSSVPSRLAGTNSPLGSRGGQTASEMEAERAAIVDELRNHHHVLAGILAPLYTSDASGLRVAEARMLRYLVLEMGNLLGQLGSRDGRNEPRLPRRAVS